MKLDRWNQIEYQDQSASIVEKDIVQFGHSQSLVMTKTGSYDQKLVNNGSRSVATSIASCLDDISLLKDEQWTTAKAFFLFLWLFGKSLV